MNSKEIFLTAAVGGIGVLHTIVLGHWVPITLIARQRGWSRRKTARVAFKAGVGHVLSTLAIGLVVWIAGVAFATWFGSTVDTAASVAMIAFGGWIAVPALREMQTNGGHSHGHEHGHGHSYDFSHLGGSVAGAAATVHGSELRRIETGHGALELSIFEDGVSPRFRLTRAEASLVRVKTVREGWMHQVFSMANQGAYWESLDAIPEPHGFEVVVTVDYGGGVHTYTTEFAEHEHGYGRHDHDRCAGHSRNAKTVDDPFYAPTRGDLAVLVRHDHAHRHGSGPAHMHLYDHDAAGTPQIAAGPNAAPPLHVHQHKTSSRTALLLILGSSPMVEGIPAFFAAGRHGVATILLMAVVFAISTIATYGAGLPGRQRGVEPIAGEDSLPFA